MMAEDLVNHPSHYISESGMECISFIDEFCSVAGALSKNPVSYSSTYYFCNMIKYLWRCDKKGGDLDKEKALWYYQRSALSHSGDTLRLVRVLKGLSLRHGLGIFWGRFLAMIHESAEQEREKNENAAKRVKAKQEARALKKLLYE